MKGWRPSAIPKGSKPVRALLRANSMPDIGSIGPVFFQEVRVPGACSGAVDAGVPFSRSCSSQPPCWANGAHASAVTKTAPALHSHHETGGTSNDNRRGDEYPEQKTPPQCLKPEISSKYMLMTQAACHREEAIGRRGDPGERRAPHKSQKRWGRRKSLKRPDSETEMERFGFRSARFGFCSVLLGFRSEKFGFRSGGFGNPSSRRRVGPCALAFHAHDGW